MNEQIDLSVVIASWNTRRLLDQCLRSLFEDLRGSGLSYEVVVIDNGSTDGSPEMVDHDYPEVRLIRNHANLGYAKANNQGISVSKGRHILLLSSDTIIHRGPLRHMVQYLDDHPDVGAVGPKLLNPDGSVQRSCWPFPMKVLLGNGFFLYQLGVLDDYRRWDHRRDRQVDCIASAALLVRRELFEKVGLLDERLFVYGAEIEWAKRTSDQGWRFVALALPEITHIGGQSGLARPELSMRMKKDIRDFNVFYFRKHHGLSGLVAYYGLTVFRGSVSLIFWWSLRLIGWPQARSRVTWYKEAVFGIRGVRE